MKLFYSALRYVVIVHLAGLVCFALIRLAFYVANSAMDPAASGLLFRSMATGWRFDNFVASFITALPLLVLGVVSLTGKMPRGVVRASQVWYLLLYIPALILGCSDIPYFRHFFSHISVSSLQWFQFGGATWGLMFSTPQHYPFIALFVVLTALLVFVVVWAGRRLISHPVTDTGKKNTPVAVSLLVLSIGLCYMGMRGTLTKVPLKGWHSEISTSHLYNQMTLNPVYFFMKSQSGEGKWNNINGLIPEEDALDYASAFLGADDPSRPLVRHIQGDPEVEKRNVVIVFMESIAVKTMETKYKDCELTPFLNTLKEKSYYFENFYSDGTHTNNGLGATLTGYPSLFDKPMLDIEPTQYCGLSQALGRHGYNNLLFVTSHGEYDYMSSFAHKNGFDRIYSKGDYPADKVVNEYGVADDFLFGFGIEKLSALPADAPFMAAFLTVSNHGPFVVPEKFRDAGDHDGQRILRFADQAMADFMEDASRQSWYENTIFVFLGDHGFFGPTPYEVSLSYNHVPCMIFSPRGDLPPTVFGQFGGQVDVFPTVMGILGLPYVNNTLGIDILGDIERPYMFFTTDTHLACLDSRYLYLYNTAMDRDMLYDLACETPENLAPQMPERTEDMKRYAASMITAAGAMTARGLTDCPSEN